MIHETRGNILKDQSEALVNPVNCMGVMGRGLALQFKKRFPDNFSAYRHACKSGQLDLGMVHVFPTDSDRNPRFIINFPTKRHWRSKSRLEHITSGLSALTATVREQGSRSIAIPPIGCGLGGLDWEDVYEQIVLAFHDLPQVRVNVYTPR